MGDDGLRHSPESCVPCSYKTTCLRKAMGQNEGLAVREEVVDRAYTSGLIGFWQRWNRKKNLQRRISESNAAEGSADISKKE